MEEKGTVGIMGVVEGDIVVSAQGGRGWELYGVGGKAKDEGKTTEGDS